MKVLFAVSYAVLYIYGTMIKEIYLHVYWKDITFKRYTQSAIGWTCEGKTCIYLRPTVYKLMYVNAKVQSGIFKPFSLRFWCILRIVPAA